MFAALVDIPPDVGYSVVFALIAVETMGIPVPGETALITAALLAHDGRMDIVPLIVIAAAAAISATTSASRSAARSAARVFEAPGPFHEHRLAALAMGEPFFERHGPKAVFLGRWVAGLRIASAWLAGMNKMPWPRFLFWNALGGICWAVSIGLGVYFVGHVVREGPRHRRDRRRRRVVTAALGGLFIWRQMRARRRQPPARS